MSRIRHNFTRAITYAILMSMMSTAFADIVFLKNGEKVEGKILRETDQQVTMEVKVSNGIFDERVIPRGDIDHIDKVSPEMEAYKAIMGLQPGTNSINPTQYDPYIRTLQGYIKQYPNGLRVPEVQATLNEFLAEKKRVEAGEAKVRGEWLSKAQVEKERTQIDGLLSLEYMKSQTAAGDNIGALNTFAAMEKNYAGAASMPEAVELARQLVAAIKPAVERAIPEQKLLKAQKEKGFAEAGAGERPEMVAAYKADMAQAEAVATAADKAGQWPPFNVNSDKALTILLARVSKESARLAGIPVEGMKSSLQMTNTAKRNVEAGDFEAALNTLKEATKLWPANELAKRLSAEAAAKKASAAKPATSAPSQESTPATPKTKTISTPRATPIKSASATPAPDDSGSFFMSLPGAIVIVVGIAGALVGVNVFKKMKARKNADVELR